VGLLRQEFPTTSFSFHHGNVTSWESQEAVFAKVVSEQGKLDIVFANAGIAEKGAFMEYSEKPTKPNMLCCDVNFYGVLYSKYSGSCSDPTLTHAAVHLAMHYMRKNLVSSITSSRGSIICTASNSGLYAFDLEPMYAATKHGVVGLVRALGRRLSRTAIQINGLAPCVVGRFSRPGQFMSLTTSQRQI
jgi:NAD(P)-dependent dehydrogenase (short-subunit alcohol dehydrogenase family)